MFAEFEPPFRSKKVLAHARGQPCTLRLPGICNGNRETTVSCHVRDRHKGGAIRSSDSSIVFGCSACHNYLDEHWFDGRVSRIVLLECVIRALQETLEILIRDEIIGWPHDRSRRT